MNRDVYWEWLDALGKWSRAFHAERMKSDFKAKARAYFDRIREDDRLWK